MIVYGDRASAALAVVYPIGYRFHAMAAERGFIWQRRATAAWLDLHERALTERTGGEFAVIDIPCAARLRIECFCATRGRANALEDEFGGSTHPLPINAEAQWFAAQRTPPLRIGRRLTVASDVADVATHPALIIPAAAAFGTGAHATTAMSLRMLERASRRLHPGWRMLDAGTGSGILALAAARFGAGAVLAMDNDPRAISTARENAALNGIGNVRFVLGDVSQRIRGTFDIITANLYSELLIGVLDSFRRCLAGGGQMILSGVMREQEPELARALRRRGMAIIEARRRGRWIALLAKGAGG